jgi:hypothetical protein
MESSFNIVNLIENNPITKLNNTYNGKLLNKIKEKFTNSQQQLFVASFYGYLHYDSKNDFIIDLDEIWKWLDFSTKQKAKILLEKQFKMDIDYKYSNLQLQQEQKRDVRGGHNKEIIMLTVKTFKLFCIKAGTKKAVEIHEYFIKLEEILQEVIQDESDELKKQLENKEKQLEDKDKELESYKTNSIIKNELLREETILKQFLDNKQCIYYGLIDDKTEKGEKLIKFGSSNFLQQRVKQHKSTFSNFRLINAFVVDNKTHIENSIKSHPILSKIRRTIKKNNTNLTELLSIDNMSFEKLDTIINDIIVNVEYNPVNYNRLLEENHRLKKDLIILKKTFDKTNNSLLNNSLLSSSINHSLLSSSINHSLLSSSINHSLLSSSFGHSPCDEIVSNYSPIGFPLRVRKYQKAKDGYYYINDTCYDKLLGTRDEVWNNIAYKTSGGLTKDELVIGKNDKVVSKNKHDSCKLDNPLPTKYKDIS